MYPLDLNWLEVNLGMRSCLKSCALLEVLDIPLILRTIGAILRGLISFRLLILVVFITI